ncbi:MAG: isoleucine--tRNA ligase [Sphaerochaetaceae bacterium]|nr:isoleucine--tRNA ligase [Sphaerochaetaceae bacterium]
MYNSVNPKVSFPQMEEQILKYWKDNNIFQKSIDSRPEDNEFVFYDGPPFATGLPHYGHLVPGTIKDIFPRYKTMKGFRVNRGFGWDCHGLPVENIITQKLGISGHKAIEEYGVGKFNDNCKSIVLRYTGEWKHTINRMGRWVDFDKGYRTMDVNYMESVWWVFKTLYEKGLIYEGYNILPYSPALACPLSNFEVNQGGYQDVVDQAVTVKFKIIDDDCYFLAWTTTPWTLPSNLALALGADIDYVKILDKNSNEKYILGEQKLSSYYKEESEYEVLNHYKGKDLEGKRYEPLFPYFKDLFEKGAFVTVLGDYVTTEDGCGIVHTAPGFGVDDYEVLKNTGIPVVCPIDDECKFTSEVSDYEGLFVKDADKPIIKYLTETGQLVKRENFLHSYPFCYRTHKPLIYRALTCWYVNVTKIKQTMIDSNEEIHWMPEHIKHGRFGKWLEGAKDWAISRNRFWGNPIPVWKSDSGDYIEVIGSKEELEKKCGQKVDDLHKQFVDELTWPSPDGKSTMHRIGDVWDCWFESGSMPYAQKHYPFENKEKFEQNFPADFICEGLDQTRGWFYTLAVIAAGLFEKPAFYNCVTNGIILSSDGRKMSKSLRNFTDPNIVMDTFGADAIRFALMNSPAVRAEDLKFSDDLVKDVLKNFLIPIWNAYYFFVTYANLDKFSFDTNFNPKNLKNPMDKWVVSAVQRLVKETTDKLDYYDVEKACQALQQFVEDLNNWYIRRSRRRFWKSESDSDKRDAYNTLYYVLLNLIKLSCPVIPFITEEIYQNLKTDDMRESVHLCDYPEYDESLRALDLEKEMEMAQKAISMGRSLRSSNNLKIRQPLKQLFIVDIDEEEQKILKKMSPIILEELNVKEVKIKGDESEIVTYKAKPNFKKLGKKLGKNMKEVSEVIQSFTNETIDGILKGKTEVVEFSNGRIEITSDDLVIQRQEKEDLKVVNDGKLTLGFDTKITKELLYEGLSRDIIRTIQNLRKDQGFEVSDRIEFQIGGPIEIKQAFESFQNYINDETLALNSEYVDNLYGAEFNLGDYTITLMVKKVGA